MTHSVWIGLPTFATTWFAIDLDGSNAFCMNAEQEFILTITKSSNSIDLAYTIWDFGDRELNSVVKDSNFTIDNK